MSDIYPPANWDERETYDLFGVVFNDHPDLTRILMPDDWVGHPLRRDYPVGGEVVEFSEEHAGVADRAGGGLSTTGGATAIPDGVTISRTGEQGAFGGELLTVNFGPHHPSTHGVLRLIVDLDGEQIRSIKPVIGYLHTGIEKQMEALRWQQGVVVTDRHDYLSPPINNLAYALAVERLMGVEAPPRAQALRVIMSELTRLSSHLVWMGTSGLELGAMSMLMYCFRERDTILDLNEEISGFRMHTSYIRPGRRDGRRHPAIPRPARPVHPDDAGARRRVRGPPDHESDLALPDDRHRPAVARGRQGARRDRADDPRLRHRLGPAQGDALLRLREIRLRGRHLERLRLLRPLPRADQRDARGGEDPAPGARHACPTDLSTWTTARCFRRRGRSWRRRWRP